MRVWDKKTKYTVVMVIAFSITMITFKNELTLFGFVSLNISIIINIIMFYLYSKEKENTDARKK